MDSIITHDSCLLNQSAAALQNTLISVWLIKNASFLIKGDEII